MVRVVIIVDDTVQCVPYQEEESQFQNYTWGVTFSLSLFFYSLSHPTLFVPEAGGVGVGSRCRCRWRRGTLQ